MILQILDLAKNLVLLNFVELVFLEIVISKLHMNYLILLVKPSTY